MFSSHLCTAPLTDDDDGCGGCVGGSGKSSRGNLVEFHSRILATMMNWLMPTSRMTGMMRLANSLSTMKCRTFYSISDER